MSLYLKAAEQGEGHFGDARKVLSLAVNTEDYLGFARIKENSYFFTTGYFWDSQKLVYVDLKSLPSLFYKSVPFHVRAPKPSISEPLFRW